MPPPVLQHVHHELRPPTSITDSGGTLTPVSSSTPTSTWVDLAKILERGKFGAIFLADGASVVVPAKASRLVVKRRR